MEIEMLQEERLRAWCQRLNMPPGAVEELVEIAQQVLADPQLHDIFAAFYEKSALRGEWHREWSDLPMDPLVREKLDKRTSFFYLLAYMAAMPQAERSYRRLGISRDIFDATMSDFTIWVNYTHSVHGYWRFNQFPWMWRHLDCKLFRLGRLQYMLAEFPGKVTGFRNTQTGQILLLADPEMPLRSDGYAEGAGGQKSGEEPWHAVFEATPAGWRGNRIAPQGNTLREEVFLLRSEWQPVLRHDDTILDLHIPRGEKMTMEECRDSLERAYQFFPEFFPDRPFRGVFCHTWFFTPQLQKLLPSDSNIVRFQREFYLYPHPGGPNFLWGFVFGEKYPDQNTAPRDTTLRRAVLDWMASSNELFDLPGVMLHRPEQWGTQPYYTTREFAPAETPALAEIPPLEDDPDPEDDYFDEEVEE